MSKKITDENGNVYVQRKPFYKKWWVWVLILLFIFYFIGISTEGETVVTESNQTDENEELFEEVETESIIEEPEESEEPAAYAVGEVITFTDYTTGDEFDVTIDNASIDSGSGETYEQPEGGKFVKIDVTAQNNGSSTYLMNASEYSIYDNSGSKGQVASKDFLLEEIAPGKNHSGSVYFEAIGDGPYEVYLHDTIWIINL